MEKSKERLAADLVEANKKLEQEKRKLRRLENLSGQRFPQTAQPSADYPWGGD